MRRRTILTTAAVIAVGALVIPTAANAANGGSWLLGRTNYESAATTVSNSAGTPLSLKAKAGYAPLAVNSTKTVTNLSADLLDGLSSGSFLRSTGKAADADKLDGLSSGSFARTTAKSGTIVHDGYEDGLGAQCPTGSIITGGGGYDTYGYPVAYSGPDYDADTGAIIPNSWLALDEEGYVLVSFANCTNVTGGAVTGAVTNVNQMPGMTGVTTMSAAPQGTSDDGSVDLPSAKEKGAQRK